MNFGARPVTGAGTYTFTAANGDQLAADHTGFSTLVRPGIVLITEHAIIDPDRSTGRFAGAEGTFTVERLADAATGVGGLTSGTFEGTITLPDLAEFRGRETNPGRGRDPRPGASPGQRGWGLGGNRRHVHVSGGGGYAGTAWRDSLRCAARG